MTNYFLNPAVHCAGGLAVASMGIIGIVSSSISEHYQLLNMYEQQNAYMVSIGLGCAGLTYATTALAVGMYFDKKKWWSTTTPQPESNLEKIIKK